MNQIYKYIVAFALGALAGYLHATRPVADTNPAGPVVVYRDRLAPPPDTVHIQSPVYRTVYRTDTDTVCVESDRTFSRVGYDNAVTYIDPVSRRLAVTRNRRGIQVPYTWNGQTMIDTYNFPVPKWNVYLEAEGRLMGDAFAAFAPNAAEGSLMAWLRLRKLHIGAGARGRVEDGRASVGSVVGVKYRVWSLRAF